MVLFCMHTVRDSGMLQPRNWVNLVVTSSQKCPLCFHGIISSPATGQECVAEGRVSQCGGRREDVFLGPTSGRSVPLQPLRLRNGADDHEEKGKIKDSDRQRESRSTWTTLTPRGGS